MSAQWSQTSVPEDPWYTALAQEDSTYVRPAGSEWNSQTPLSSTQDFQPMDAYAWTQTAHGSVDTGLSPVLSHKSQSSHTLNSFPEPDFAVLPPGVDFPFLSEPQWNAAGTIVCAGPQQLPMHMPGNTLMPAHEAVDVPGRMTAYAPQLPLEDAGHHGHSQLAHHALEARISRPMVSYQAIAPRTSLQPKEESSQASDPMAIAHVSPQRPIRPFIQGTIRSRDTSQTVSTSTGPHQAISRHHSVRPIAPTPVDARRTQPMFATTMDTRMLQDELGSFAGPISHLAYSGVADPTAEDFNAFIQYDQDEHTSVAALPRSAND